MRSYCLVLFAMLVFQPMIAQEFQLPLWPAGKIPNARASTEKEVREVSNITLIRGVQEPAIQVFLPSKANATKHAILVCPGGGYGVLAYDWEGTDIAKWLNANGIAAIVLKYRLPSAASNVTPHLSPSMDAQRAMRMIRSRASEWNIDPGRIGIMGFSAGGHLASTVGTHFTEGDKNAADAIDRHSSRPDFMILMYPVISMTKKIMHEGSRDNLIGRNASKELAEHYSTELQVTKNTPPTLLIHASDDDGVPVENSLLFYQALKDNKVPAALYVFPKGGHGFSLAMNDPYLHKWTDLCIEWIRQR